MKKRVIATILLAVFCIVSFSGCSLAEKLEKDVQVRLIVGDETWGPYTVSIFENAIVPQPEAPTGKMFFGWTADKDWQNKDFSTVKTSQSKGLIRYDDVKDYLNGSSEIDLYPVYGEKPRHDLAIAWYDKENTSGLNQTVIDDFWAAVKQYLISAGKNPEQMDLVIRGYQGNVGTTCGNIIDDGDIDIMVGWAASSNLEGTGGLKPGVDFLQNYGNVTLTGGAKARYVAKLSDTELVNDVYQWILTTYGGDGATKDYDVNDTPVEPDPTPNPDPDPTPGPTEPLVITDKKLVVSIWNNAKGEWITDEQIAKLETDFNAYLTGRGVDASTLEITWRKESATKVGDLGKAVLDADDVDFVLACGANVETAGGLVNIHKLKIADSAYMTADRYIAVLNKDNPRQLATILYEFISGTAYSA